MNDSRAAVRWPPRVRKEKIRRLYEQDARGIVDEALIEEVGFALYSRCRSILAIRDARQGRVPCPRCENQGAATIILRQSRARDELLHCPECGWELTWLEYQRTFKRRQLHSGGAVPAFEAYISRFEQARTPQERMLAIDRVIHEYHYSLRDQPERPTRPAAVNLIEGRLADVIQFLDQLTYGHAGTSGTAANREEWREKLQSTFWPDFLASREEIATEDCL